MSPQYPGQPGGDGEFGKWDAYPLWVAETGRLSDRRQLTNTLFLSINSVLIGGVAVLAEQGIQAAHLQISATLLLVQILLAIAGYVLSHQWLKLLKLYGRLLRFRYQVLRETESQPGFPGSIQMYLREDQEGEKHRIFGFGELEEFIPTLFKILYVVVTLLLIFGVVAVRIHLGEWLAQYISIPVLK